MRPYEVVLIFDVSLEEETIRAAVDRFVDFIRTHGGNPGRVDRWGRRRFAYELNHRWEGYYVLIEATSEPSTMVELHRTLSLADEVMRHKIVRIPKEVAGAVKAEPAAVDLVSDPAPA